MYGRVSFRLTDEDQPLILVPTLVNGDGQAPYDFILDTGAGMSLLSTELARNLNVRATEFKEAAGAGGKIQVGLGSVRFLSVGHARVENVRVAITQELTKISACCGTTIEGCLGYNFLRNFRLEIDYRNRLLTLHGGQLYPDTPKANGTEVGFRLAQPSKPLVIVPVLVNGKRLHPFVLDTGASTTMVSARLADDLGVLHTRAPKLAGAGGTLSGSLGMLRTLKIGSTELDDIQVVVSDFLETLSQLIDTEVNGVIGYNVLRQFCVTIDYPRARFRLSP